MKKSDTERTKQILDRLDQLMAADAHIIEPRPASEERTISASQLEQYGRNHAERKRLQDELKEILSSAAPGD